MQHIFSRRPIFSLILFSFMIALVCPGAALSQDCEQPAGTVASVQGTVEARRVRQDSWQTLKLNDTLCPGDTVRVADNSRADIALANQSVLRLDADSELTLEGVSQERTSRLNMFKGAAHFFSRQPRGLEVETPYTIAGVRGTEFLVTIEEGRTLLSVYEGAVLAQNDAGSLTLQSGQSAVAEAGKAPVLRVVAKPRDAVQWALYYPPVIYTPPGAVPARDENDPRYHAQNAAQLLAVGRVDEANAAIAQALKRDPNSSDALALQTIIAIVQNDKERALDSAQKAVDADPSSATALIAMSYAQQARFNLEGARDSLDAAVAADPQNALAWARLAEIQAAFGRLGKALDAAQKAVAIDPDLARTQTVLGFAYLNQVKTARAREAFEKAIQLDSADPLPRLGLGLAKIRDGALREGGQEIEIAASLDPNNSLIRSYMGKVYFEEKRTGMDTREYEIAKELDPNDPTPYFYGAITKQTTNRPVEALRDYQKAIELNDNRAVYRSQLQLDADLAARSAATARIYNDLGFGQLGLVEGYNSVNTDPTNFSAHRFLADTNATLPRHEIARVSELLQSQLLQPINITPIQPGLAESNLFLISSQGAAASSFNEFNPLFTRNRAAVQASGLYGSNETWAGEGIVSGIYKGLSLSAGYTHFETDGWRLNADQEDDIANAFAQWEITPNTSIQAEYRYRDNQKGDIQQEFFEDSFDSTERNTDETNLMRGGFRHAFTPGSILLGNFSYQDAESTYATVPAPGFWDLFNIDATEDAYGAELQYLFRSKYINLVSGGGYFSTDLKEIETSQTIFDPVPVVTTLNSEIEHTNLYLYSYIYFPKNVTVTIGASGDFFEKDDIESNDYDIEEDQINPKFGIQWNPLPGTTLRGAVFRTFKRTLITDQTLEPTQVAGFNQFYDDFNATETWVYGGAVDQKFSQSFFGGGEFTYRDLDVPWQFEDFFTGLREVRIAEWEEKLFRAYLFWTPHEWFSLTGEWMYEKYDRKGEFGNGIQELETNYFPLGINFFHSSGISIMAKGTYIKQKGVFEQATFVTGEDDFWVVDSSISYRFPKRYGFLTVGVSNLTDEKFNYYDTDPDNPRIQPERSVFAKLTLSFP